MPGRVEHIGSEDFSLAAKIATALSYVFSPLFVPVIGVSLVCVYYGASAGEVVRILISASICFIVAPTAMLFWLKKTGRIATFQIREKQDRRLPLLIGLAIACASVIVIVAVAGTTQKAVGIYLLGVAGTTGIALLISSMTKMSIHVAAFSALAATVVYMYKNPTISSGALFEFGAGSAVIALLVLVAVVWSRYYCRAHSPGELLIGAGVGAVPAWGVMIAIHFWYQALLQ